MKGMPQTDSTSTNTTTPGKKPLALPGLEKESLFESQYEVELVDEEAVKVAR